MLKEKTVVINMTQGGGMTDPVYCNGLLKSEVPAIREALDASELYKSKGYAVVYEEETYTDKSMALPAAITMTGKRDRMVQFKMRNSNGQLTFVEFEIPVNPADLTDIQAINDGFVGMSLASGTIAECSYTIKY